MDVHNMLRQIYRKANERPAPWVDHAGNLRDPRTGMKLAGIKGANGALSSEEEEEEEIAGYSFFDSVSPREVV
jgi:carnitine O-acetyltransferase